MNTDWKKQMANCLPVGRVTPCAPQFVFARTAGRGLPALPIRVHPCPSVVKMALPDLIEIVPLDKPVRAEITVPGSKSITNRALILAALAEGEVTLEGAAELGREPAAEFVDHGDHEVVAPRKMQEHGAMRHANRFGDVGRCRIDDALSREQHHGGVDQPVARDHFLFPACRCRRLCDLLHLN